jgi:hypothetical protein
VGFEFARSYELKATVVACAVASAVLASCSSGGASPSSQVVVASPTSDSATRHYVALIHSYWIQEQAADGVSNGSNLAAKVCLGMDPPGARTNLQLIDPPMCLERADAILTNQEKFLSDLDTTRPPPQFAADDQTFRTQLPMAFADLELLISAAKTGNSEAVLQAATAYNNDMFPAVTDALNDVDPSVAHP